MEFIKHHIRTIIKAYQGPVPLAISLRAYFAKHKQLGSRDRKMIKEAVYAYYRLARFVGTDDIDFIMRYAIAQGLITHNRLVPLFIGEEHSATDVHDVKYHDIPLSHGMSASSFYKHILQKPLVYLRNSIRMDASVIKRKLNEHKIEFREMTLPHIVGSIFAISADTPLQHVLQEETYIIQDLSSQRSLSIAINVIMKNNNGFLPIKIWDACSGAGGKTLLLRAKWADADIMATDIRDAILANLRKRISLYRLNKVITKNIDLSRDEQLPCSTDDIDLIVCDVPCSGSGTWGRSPEQFHFFSQERLDHYTSLQRSIMDNVLSQAKADTWIVYITCSAFAAENEEQIAYLADQHHVEVYHQELINGVEDSADTLFVAVMKTTVSLA